MIRQLQLHSRNDTFATLDQDTANLALILDHSEPQYKKPRTGTNNKVNKKIQDATSNVTKLLFLSTEHRITHQTNSIPTSNLPLAHVH
jgi:hypothetical protein